MGGDRADAGGPAGGAAAGHGLRVQPRHLTLALVSLVGGVMSTWRLGVGSIRGDETYYREAAAAHRGGDWLANAQHPPLAKELIAMSQSVLGEDAVADRLPSVVCAWLTGYLVAATVWQLTRRTRAGVAAGIAAAALWWTLPFHPARTATLEAPLVLLMTAATYAWLRATAEHALRWFAAGGALVGLAVATKLTGALAVVGALPALWSLARRARPGRSGDRELEPAPGDGSPSPARTAPRLPVTLAVTTAAMLLAWALPYVPMGADAVEAVRTSVTFQAEHAAEGHPYPVAGRSSPHPPWWSAWWFQTRPLGVAATVSLWVLALVGAVRHRSRSAPVALTLAMSSLALATSPLQLPHYQYLWWPMLVTLAAAAWVPPAPRSTTGRPVPLRRVSVVVSVLALALTTPLVVSSVRHGERVKDLEVSDYRSAGALLETAVTDDTPVTVWADPRALRVVLPDQRLRTSLPRDANPAALVVEPAYAERRDGMDVGLWLRCRSARYEQRDDGDVTVYLRDDRDAVVRVGDLPAECSHLRISQTP